MLGRIPPNWGCHQQVTSFWFQHGFLSPQKWEGKFLVSADDFVLWKAIDYKINSAALFYDWLAFDCFVTYGPDSMTLMNVFEIGGTAPSSILFLSIFLFVVADNFIYIYLEHFRHQNSWSISDSVFHAIFKASPVSLSNTRTTSLPRCV